MKKGKYYIGLDCGTNSVGWAVTDEEYNLLRAKGKTMWGVRLFDEAKTAAERRLARGSRRRNDRADGRLKLLRMLFQDEIVKVDPDFYKRLDESFYILEDKMGLTDVSSDTLFNDLNFKDKDFHKKYKTIWHLRDAIIKSKPDEHFDIRLYFLAIQHIYKHRGHFLIDGELKGNAGDFKEIYAEFCDAADEAGFAIKDKVADEVEKVILDKKKTKNDKKRLLKELMVDEDVNSDGVGDYTMLVGLLIGSRVDLNKLFGLDSEEENRFSFAEVVFEKEADEIEAILENSGYFDVILAAKKIYDYALLKNLLKDSNSVSEAMVKNYNLHKEDLGEIKRLLKPFPKEYAKFFKDELTDVANYNAYIGKAYSGVEKSGRKKTILASQEDVNKELSKIFKSCKIDLSKKIEFKERLENGELLPKQRGQAKGTIPQQLHHNELEMIVEKLVRDYPNFGKQNLKENEKYNTKAKKLLSIHDFRRPYYCGPLKQRKYDDAGNLINGCGSEFSWADEEIKQIVYPWNFYDEGLVNLDARAEKFITRMTNDCTYLRGEKVLPKASLLYQKYMVLNEINNLKINGNRINDLNLKRKIYELFEKGELSGNLTLKRFEKVLKDRKIIDGQDELGGSAEHKTLPKMSTHQDFKRILGDEYRKRYTSKQLEETILAITILGEEKKMLKKKIETILECNKEEAEKLAKNHYKDWGKFSAKFLTSVKAMVGGKRMSILEALEETNDNLMEILGSKYDFTKELEEYNRIGAPDMEIKYEEVKNNLYCSPAVKRSVWQAVKIVKEITDVMGMAPAKIFLESTREETNAKNKGVALARRKRLEETYKAMKKDEQTKELLKALDNYEDRDFQKKKLFLYFQQMGKCAYSGKPIDLDALATDAYDIDHIYPQSLTKDDSLEKNKVLVCAEYNRAKSNVYPISEDIRNKMRGIWWSWRAHGLISEEKYNRLMRGMPLTDDELGGFIARQIVETSQTVQAVRKMFEEHYPMTKVVLVKAGQVSDFRKTYGYDQKDRSGQITEKGNPEFIKLRALNDLHHAKDAYLNVVVGNTMSQTFTDNPVRWIKQNHPGEQKHYSINTKVLFRKSERYFSKKLDKDINWPVMKGWEYDKSFAIVSKNMKRNDVLWTRMTHDNSNKDNKGQISDLKIVGGVVGEKEKGAQKGMMPIKENARLAKTAQYGGYNSLNGAYFVLIEQMIEKKGARRKLVQIPIVDKNRPQKYLDKNYPNSRIIIQHIPFGVLLKKDGFLMSLTGRSQESIKFYPAVQIFIKPENCLTLKRVVSVCEKIKKTKGKYEVEEEDEIGKEQIANLYAELVEKLQKYFKMMPAVGGRVEEIVASKEKFDALTIEDQCSVVMELLNVMGCNAMAGDLTKLIPKSEHFGWGSFSNDISDNEIEMIKQSVTGLMEKRINLNKIETGEA